METLGNRFRRLMKELGINEIGEDTINPVMMNLTIKIKYKKCENDFNKIWFRSINRNKTGVLIKMGKKTLEVLNDKLFAQLDRLEAVDLKDSDALVAEINRTQATVNISRMVVDNAALILRAHMARENTIGSNYEMPDVLQIESGKKE